VNLENAADFFQQASQLQIEGKLSEAINAYTKAIELTFHNIGGILIQQDNWEEAFAVYRKAIELIPNSAESYHNLGKAFAQQGNWEEAIICFRKAIELIPNLGLLPPFSYSPCQEDVVCIAAISNPQDKYRFQSGLGSNTSSAEIYHSLGEALSQVGQLQEACTYYQEAIKLNKKLWKPWYKLGEAWMQLYGAWGSARDCFQSAIELNPDFFRLHEILGQALAQEGNLEGAIAAYYRAIELNPNSYGSHELLGEAFGKLGHLNYTLPLIPEVISDCLTEVYAAYRCAAEGNLLFLEELNFDLFQFLSELSSIFAQEGNSELAIAACEQAVNVPSNTGDVYLSATSHYMIAALLAKQGMRDEAISYFQKTPQLKLSEEAIYENIWNGMNQILPTLNDNFPDYLTEVNQQSAYQYFDQNSQYKEITISSLSENDKIFLVNSGLSLANLELIFKDDIFLEEIYINSFIPQSKHQLSKQVEGKAPPMWQGLKNHACHKSIVETGYIYSVCPTTGKVIRSQQSFHSVSWLQMLFYRFVGCEVFYLLIGHTIGCKVGIYFPRLNLIIYQLKDPNIIPEINRFKSYAVSYWQEFKRYISSNTPKELVAAQGFYPNLGHYLWNDVTGLQYLYDNGILNKISKLLMGPHEYLNVGDIFPEIHSDKIVKVPNYFSVFKTILENNYFAVRATGYAVTQGLATRIYEAYHKKCSKTFLEEVERSKKHFPLLCFQIRTHNRVWLSQVEGIANIITSLYPDFPNIGVVFEGFSRPEREELNKDVKKTDYTWDLEKMIESENAVVDQIRTLIPSDICIYSAIGSMIYETIVWDHAMDMFIAPGGSGLTFISWIANKPGVIHGNREACVSNAQRYWIESRENIVPPVFISLKYVVDDEASTSHPPNRNYNCDWKVVYQEALKILKQLQERG
jgi:tetratricopeptide (TPR) repeat protein